MSFCLRRPDLIPAMCRASRSKAERRFGTQAVVTALRRILDLPAATGQWRGQGERRQAV